MCIFILGIIPSDADLQKVKGICESQGFCFDVVESKCSTKLESKVIGRLTRDNCDCNTWLGSEVDYDDPPSKDPRQKLIDKYRRKGWSENKIERAIAQEKPQLIKDTSNKKLEIQNWNLLFSRLLQLCNFNCFGLLMHMYDDSIKHEEFAFDTMEIRQSQCGEKALLNLRRDRLYIFRA
jgi:hypothetical protein